MPLLLMRQKNQMKMTKSCCQPILKRIRHKTHADPSLSGLITSHIISRSADCMNNRTLFSFLNLVDYLMPQVTLQRINHIVKGYLTYFLQLIPHCNSLLQWHRKVMWWLHPCLVLQAQPLYCLFYLSARDICVIGRLTISLKHFFTFTS